MKPPKELPQKILTEKRIRKIFDITIIAKGIHAILEIMGGILIFFISKSYIVSSVLYLTQEELTEDPKDIVAHFLLQTAQNLTISAQYFTAIYLFIHGVVKIFLVLGLLKKKLWAYPTSIVVFTLFVVYQLFRYSVTHSIWLLLLTALDLIIIGLTWHEYKYIMYNLNKE